MLGLRFRARLLEGPPAGIRSVIAMTSVLGASSGDAVGEVVRATGVSNKEARRRVELAKTVEALPDRVLDLLGTGSISTEHVTLLGSVAEMDGINALVELAAVENPLRFKESVTQHELAVRGDEEMAEKQRRLRSLRFFDAAHGMTGLTGVLPPVEGAQVRATLEAIADRAYRDAHPERAETLGGHNAEPLERRLADALVTAVLTPSDQVGKTCPEIPAVIVSLKLNDQTAELMGANGGPIPFATALDIAALPGAKIYGAVMDRAGDVLWMKPDERFAGTIKGLAVTLRDIRCVFPGCDRPHTRAEVHHVIEYDNGGPTLVWNLVLLCDPHHHFLHDNKLIVKRTNGQVTIVRSDGTLYAATRATGPPTASTSG